MPDIAMTNSPHLNLRREKKRAQAKNNVVEEAKICDELGQALSFQGCYEGAIDEYLHDLQLRESLSDTIGQAVANRRIGECYTELRSFEHALKYLDEYLSLSRQCCSLVEEQRAWATLGRTYLIQSEEADTVLNTRRYAYRCWAKAENAFTKSLELCASLEGDVSARELCQMRARLRLNLGLVFDNRRNMVKAAEHLKESASLSRLHSLDDDLYKAQSSLTLTLMKMPRREWALADKTASLAMNTALQLKKRPLQAEAQTNKAKIKLLLRDFRAAKKALKKAHQLSSKEEKSAVMEFLEQVFRLERLHSDVTRSRDAEEKMALLEKMADKAASYQLLQLALDLYGDTLKLLKLQKPARDPGPLYFSLGQTYADDLQHDSAIRYFGAELECQANQPSKACRTVLRIALEQENAAKDYDVIMDSYEQALLLAERAMDAKLQARCLQCIVQLQELHNKPTDSIKLQTLADEYNLDLANLSEEEDSQEKDDGQSKGSDDEDEEDGCVVDLDDISDSDAEEEFDRGTQLGKRRPRTFPVKKNDKGESLLHVACIEGNVKKVRNLLQKGHPLSVQDNCGWTPLHEACNHGHLEIVDLLLGHGANINDAGGALTDGVTPLHDACAAGNVEVIEMLVDKGANLFSKDRMGNTALDSLSGFCKRSNPRDLTDQERSEVRRVQATLFKSMTGRDLNADEYFLSLDVSDQLPEMTRERQRKRRAPSPGAPTSSSSDSDDVDENRRDQSSRPRDSDQPGNAKDDYRTTMKSMGSSAQRMALNVRSTHAATRSFKEARSALVDGVTAVGDDWLIEDVKDPVKRRRPDLDRILGPGSTKKRRTESARSDKRSRTESVESANKRIENNNIEEHSRMDRSSDALVIPGSSRNEFPPDFDIIDDDNDDNDDISFLDIFDDDDNRDQEPSRVAKKFEKQARITQYTEPLQGSAGSSGYASSGGFSRTENASPRLAERLTPTDAAHWSGADDRRTNFGEGPTRLRIRVQGELMVVPVSQNDATRTIDWLCEQTSRRYCHKHGRRPRLSLHTPDGASLASDDVIRIVIRPNEELVAVFHGWTERGLTTRYQDASTSSASAVYRNVKSRLEQCTLTQHLLLSDLVMRTDQFRPIVTAIQQSHIHTLRVNGNRLEGDVLIDLVSGLTGLTVLDLSSNLIDHVGLSHLVTGLKRSESRNLLTTLSLSYNCLTDASAPAIVDLLESAPRLARLAMAGCRMTSGLFSSHRLALEGAFQRSLVDHLDLSNNRFGREGLRALLNTVPPKLKSLNLARSNCDTGSEPLIMDKLSRILDCMEELNLSGCRLTQNEIEELISALPKCEKLRTLNLSNNAVALRQVQQLLENSLDTALENLQLLSCGLSGPMDTQLVDCLVSKMGSVQPLRTLSLTCDGMTEIDTNSIVHVWNTVWNEKGKSVVKGARISLWVEDAF